MIRILFDITPIVSGAVNNMNRGGIYFCACHILEELESRKDVCVDFYCSSAFVSIAEKEMEKCTGRKKRVINKNVFNNRISQLSNMIIRKKSAYKKAGKVLRKYVLAVLEIIVMKTACMMDDRYACDGCMYDVFFSVRDQAPVNIRRSKRILTVLVLHDVIEILYPECFPTRLRRFRRSKLQYLLSTMDNREFFLANSYCTKKDFLKCRPDIEPNRVQVVYHAAGHYFQPCSDSRKIEAIKAKYHIPAEKKYVFSLCAIEPRKNLVRIIKSFVQFIEKNHIDDLALALGGKEWDSFKVQFEKETGAYLDGRYVVRMGYVQDEDLPVLYSGAEWFVYTSQYEGFGVPPLEAMCCGCPVIVSDNSSIPEVVGDAGLLIPWDSDMAHVAAYEKYYFDREARRDFAQKGLERSRKFSWRKSVDCMMTLIEKTKKGQGAK